MKRILSRALPLTVVLLGIFTFVHADTTTGGSGGSTGALNVAPINNFFGSLVGLVNSTVVPVIFAIAFVVFLWGVYKYFIAGGANEEKRQEGAQFVMWSIIGFVIMISLWGIVNVVNSSLPFGDGNQPKLPTFDSTTGGTQTPVCDPACVAPQTCGADKVCHSPT